MGFREGKTFFLLIKKKVFPSLRKSFFINGVTGVTEGGTDFVEVSEVAGFHSDLEKAAVDIVIDITACVVDADDVCAERRDDRRDAGEFAGAVEKFDSEFGFSAAGDETAVDDA